MNNRMNERTYEQKKIYCTQENDLSRYSGNQNEVEKSRRSLVSLCNGYYNNNQK